MKKNKGFTLIELLVVIAIIGILASVVLASLSSARDKGKDAAVKSQLAAMKAQAELYYSTAESYSGICAATQATNGFGDTTGPGLLKAASDSSGISNTISVTLATAGLYNQTLCHDSADAWAVEAPLSTSVSGTPKMYCSDSTGVSKEKSAVLAASAVAC
ncbi:MAG: PHA accumulation regulator DNA-binding-like protein [Candidatus Nomurabacteria bacterium GW2011_GWF2_35_66]|uniref:PHA accumulation regulator DNA-binding-like protein n=1 Tax=Candidatus Nomurabacteria bacterium GW2011_GWE1_35_16 TaxID=1618761 RepID=A0A0G0BSW4_9BACT|nr:MAG: PHA accumulation regulator DNA-binding-like protein [Candidatus Nomurabacteria bacterium GW2011_GWF1_34_20]KKP63609.1 MAG: PHA accumulation regulator DNA-binding-like protein [Candidatus Nomurabacteria bacterium GW2011_GWE2_34_25]KKP66811.1 MAG: PHA accumulation regulator DNA-binding-like protein [Candidatus Nomurabacteria bacterium GW2011_GWE1_35_16]KKP83437.1 MAG: PHA accumulation regulator DNA-binding-like protein [Candidatus Nomurabacteria bacterium GW2011_GWF2_35_66]HAE36631.1 hypo